MPATAQTKRAPAKTAPPKATKRKTPKATPSHPADLPQLLYTKPEVAAVLRASVPTIERLIARGTLVSLKVGRWRCVPAWAVEQFIAEQCGQPSAS